MEYGYARVSTKEQNEQRQIVALEEFGLDRKQIFTDKQSGKDFERTNYRKLVRRLKEGDTLVVKSIDRLGRNYEEILEQWRIITRQGRGHRGAGYAPAGYPKKPGPHRHADRGHCFAAFKLCGPDRAGVHPAAAGGGYRRGESARRALRTAAAGTAEGVPRRASGVAEKRDLRAGGRTETERYPQDIPQMGAATVKNGEESTGLSPPPKAAASVVFILSNPQTQCNTQMGKTRTIYPSRPNKNTAQ